MEDLSLFDELLFIFWLLVFFWVLLISVQAVIRDHCRRVILKRKIKLRGLENETSLCRTNK